MSYGADPTGGSDSTKAFQQAVDSSDVYVGTAGTYLINGSVHPPSNRNIRCAPGVTLKTTNHNGGLTGIFYFGQATGGSVAGCDFQGANTSVPAPLDGNGGNYLIVLTDSSNVMIEGNTFEYTYADCDVIINAGGANTGGSNNTVQYNTFNHNPLYGACITAGTHHTLQNNLSFDSNIGVEANTAHCGPASNPPVGYETIRNNQITYVHGNCARLGIAGCTSGVWITGGESPSGCDFSSNVVSGNSCSGTDGVQSANIQNAAPSGGTAASYSGNMRGPHCYCVARNSC